MNVIISFLLFLMDSIVRFVTQITEYKLKLQKIQKQMSENQLMMRRNEGAEQQKPPQQPLLDIYEAQNINQLLKQQNLNQFYTSLNFPCCSKPIEPKLTTIAEYKNKKGKKFIESQQIEQSKKLLPYDGVFEYQHSQKELAQSSDLLRLKARLVQDLRQQYFQQNGQFIIEKQFFHEQLSRLANISFQENYAINTYQKNAILSERNNQKKSTPFELQLNIGCIWFTKHSLQNKQQQKFEELRPLMQQLSVISAYPILPQLSKQLKYLMQAKQQLLQNQASQLQLQQIVSKIQITRDLQQKQIDHVHTLMDTVLRKWKQIKQLRRMNNNMQTVPWRVNVKQYDLENLGNGQASKGKSYDIGLTPMQINQKISGEGAEEELNRRINIKKEKYFLKVYINGDEVAKSQKVHLQWPSYKVNFNQKFNIIVYSAPSSVQVQVIKSGLINQIIDKVSLALPGINSKTITSAQRRLAGASFALNGQKFRKGAQQARAPSGSVIYRIQWKGEGSRMPPISFKAQQQQTVATLQTESDQQNYELYDMKDPRALQIKRQVVEDEVIQTTSALLPFVDIQSARHLLLKLKATHPQFQNIQVPLLQQHVRRRQDLLGIIEQQKVRSLQQFDEDHEQIYNPSQGIFKTQDNNILDQIKQTLSRVQFMKINSMRGGVKYKITEQIVNEYIFEQMESPIVVFCRNLFTQKRKLGPQVSQYQQARNIIENIDINLHLRSARNMPIREQAFARIRNFQQQQIRMNPARLQQMAAHTGNMDMYGNYGTGFYQKQPGMNLQGNNFFVPGLMNMGGGVRPNMQASYQKKNLQRNSTYIELRFKKILKRTDCFQGPFPQWNQTLQFNYNMKSQLMTVQKLFVNNEKSLKFLLFDMTEQSKPTTSIAEARIKKSKYYLGRIQVPMSMLVAVPSISGLFKVERPLILFGYGIKKAGLFDFDQDIEEANKTEFPDVHTFLNLDLFTDPLIDNLTAYNSDRKFISGGESTLLLQRCSDWLEDLNTKRYIRLWLSNIQGRSVFICKFLSSNIAPPPLGPENIIERCARFVGMIPKKFNCKLLENTEQFHLTCHQFLNIKMGQDHGILLCNYFNYIDKHAGRDHIESYLAIGKAFPYGKSIFVVRRNKVSNDVEIWDPYQGQCVFIPEKQYDSFCFCFKYAKKKQGELQKQFCNMIQLGCLVSENNVYINIQQSMKPQDLDYNLEQPKLWRPFLSQKMRTEYFQRGQILTIQHQITEDFYPKPKGIESQVQNRLYEYIRSHLQSERKKHFRPYTFKINSNVSNYVRNKILFECQTFKNDFRLSGSQSKMYSQHSAQQKAKYSRALTKLEEAKNQIKSAVDADKFLYGFTLNIPYTSNKQIWDKIQQTHVHLDQTENMEFVLAIRCFQLACHVISVWVFVGTIV